LDSVVFNTEAHPFPRFEMGKLFSTGWKRKPRDSSGMVLKDVTPAVIPETPVEVVAAEVGVGGGGAKTVIKEVEQVPISAS